MTLSAELRPTDKRAQFQLVFSPISACRVPAALVLAAFLAACSADPGPGLVNDPFEAQNRRAHEFNRGLDRALVRPTSRGYGAVVPAPLREMVANFADNLSLPGDVVNNILQGRPEPALSNTFRFAFNTVLGFGGLVDPAALLGVNRQEADFGGTLAAWGVRQGAYLELPVLGPSSERDAAGMVVDFFLDPLNLALDSPESHIGTATGAVSSIGDRYTFSETIDSILYDSADSYAQTRLFYLQNRRFELGDSTEDDIIDPYEDIYGP